MKVRRKLTKPANFKKAVLVAGSSQFLILVAFSSSIEIRFGEMTLPKNLMEVVANWIFSALTLNQWELSASKTSNSIFLCCSKSLEAIRISS